MNSPVIPEPVIFCWYLNGFLETSCLHDLTFITLTLGILVITIPTFTIRFTIPKPLCEHYIMGPFFLILQSLLIPYLQPHQLPVSKSILLTIMFSHNIQCSVTLTHTKKPSTHPKLFQTHMVHSATLILPTSRLQFYFNFKSYNEMWSFNSVIFI